MITLLLLRLGALKRMTSPRQRWFARYQCGCSEDAARKRDLLEYCGIHGGDRVECFRIILPKDAPVVDAAIDALQDGISAR